MNAPERIQASRFTKRLKRHRPSRSEIVVVTRHDRVVGGYLSPAELARYQRWKAAQPEVLKVGELDDETIAQIEAATYGVAA